ncbi:MAG: hypothetical protein ACRCY5_07030 [Phocaeicola sp.]
MVKTNDKQNIEVAIDKIQERGFKFDYDFDCSSLSKESLNFGFGLKITPNFPEQLLGIEVAVQYKYEHTAMIISELHLVVWFKVEGLESICEFSGEDELIIKAEALIPTLVNVSVGTARGMLYAKLKGTPLESFPLPLLSNAELMKGLKSEKK